MEIFVRGDNVKVTEAIESYIGEKLKRIEKYIGDSETVRATAVINVKNHNQKVEVTIPLKTFILRAEETQDDLYAAIDIVTDKLERQIRKNKTKLQTKKMKEVSFKEFVIDEIEEDDEDSEEKIVKRKTIEVKPMSEEEAILQMELLGHQFYIFKDSETLKPAVVYKRKEGNYGIIESE
ncbi:MAG: ribosome-associated translation inhibitor RaiA [Bacilli bacterium]|nr:ribosome-associated translation inhibitor RaiA [Bacilli bacterium]